MGISGFALLPSDTTCTHTDACMSACTYIFTRFKYIQSRSSTKSPVGKAFKLQRIFLQLTALKNNMHSYHIYKHYILRTVDEEGNLQYEGIFYYCIRITVVKY